MVSTGGAASWDAPCATATCVKARSKVAIKVVRTSNLTMRLSDAGLRRRQPKLIYSNHRPSPWLNEDANPRDRSNRLLDDCANSEFASTKITPKKYSN